MKSVTIAFSSLYTYTRSPAVDVEVDGAQHCPGATGGPARLGQSHDLLSTTIVSPLMCEASSLASRKICAATVRGSVSGHSPAPPKKGFTRGSSNITEGHGQSYSFPPSGQSPSDTNFPLSSTHWNDICISGYL